MNARYEVLVTVMMKIRKIWNMTPCRLVYVCQVPTVGGTCCSLLQNSVRLLLQKTELVMNGRLLVPQVKSWSFG